MSLLIKTEINKNTSKDVRNLFKLKENEAIKDKTIRNWKSFWAGWRRLLQTYGQVIFIGNYIEYESNEDEIKTLLIEECLNKIRL